MKKTGLILILFFASFFSFSQTEIFKIDSIPAEGILLNKGWKFHIGDNPNYAKPDFDDSKWESIDPTKDVMDLPQIPRNGKIVWLRLRINVDSSMFNEIYGFTINQTGATEIYQNGFLVNKFGKISNIVNKITAVNPSSEPTKNNYIFSFFEKNTLQLSIRYVFEPDLIYLKILERPNPLLKLSLNSNDNFNNNTFKSHGFDATFLEFFRAGIFFILTILHLVLFILKPKFNSNLYTALYYFSVFLFFIIYSYHYHFTHIVKLRMHLLYFEYIIAFFASITTLLIVYSYLDFEKKWPFWLIFFFPVLFFTFFIKDYFLSGVIATIFPVIMNIDAIRITGISIKNKKPGSWLMFLGTFGWTLFYIFILIFSLTLDQNKEESKIIQETLFSISFFIFPICITLILARDFTNTSKSLEFKLVEVQQLSQEKQETLQKQNTELQAALLKGQTTERQRVAIDLHDNLGSTISSIKYSLEAIDRSKMNADEVAVQENLYSLLDKAYNDVRLLSHNLLPEEFEKLGLAETLATLVRKMNKNGKIKFELEVDENIGRLDKKVEFELYSICLELVNNIMKHSKATDAKIVLISTEKSKNTTDLTHPLGARGLLLIVSDNGIGTFKNDSDGLGMKNIQARVDSIGGTWTVKAVEGEGVVNEIVIPRYF